MDAITGLSDGDTKGEYHPVVRLIGVGEADEPEPEGVKRISRGSIAQSFEQTRDLAVLLREITEEAGLSVRKLSDTTEDG